MKNLFKEYRPTCTISKIMAEELLARMGRTKPDQHGNGYNLHGRQELLFTLRFLATGCFRRADGDLCGVSQPTVLRIEDETVRKMLNCLISALCSLIKLNWYFNSQNLCYYMVFPSIAGTINCTHVPIKKFGGEKGELFRNRKRFFSLDVQAINNAEGHITNIVCRWLGSAHESTIFGNSRLCSQFENGNIRGVFLGDNGYPYRPYPLTAFLSPTIGSWRRYNRSQPEISFC